MYNFIRFWFFILLSATLLFSCSDSPIPRPYGYYRVDLPQHSYRSADTLHLPYTFDLSLEARIVNRKSEGEKFWIDIEYPHLNASLYCSYKKINGNLREISEDCRRIVYKHQVKADGIMEKVFAKPADRVYGVLYDLQGNTASSLQFVLTDSTHHFLRGALYFNNVPNKDSIAPMAEYIREDVIRLMESFKWKR